MSPTTNPERWHDFATSFAGAAGALLGLAFAAISFNLDAILRYKTLPGRRSKLVGLAAAIDVPRWRRERDNPLGWRLGHLVPPIVTILLAILGAVATMTTSFGGLYWLAAAMALATTTGLINSWVLLVEIKR